MMKIHIKLIGISILFLTGCYPCRPFDWNCNQSTKDTSWYKESEICDRTQMKLAKERLNELYTKEVMADIMAECVLSNGKYKFDSDPKYSNIK
ncbi:hypothetical protein EV697_10811 [Bisgaardia hudsonensis]|uniref:Lipoprotein n=1 Tax=Bisgaardia hudsonensis TaxID=109472 RepID=A0A4R2MZT4_9PAST|nr:hypothetical protein [Bisgaardia hudsonensis]QLB12874.1 hypothetical protein A6A11_04255 [Bisgaardia hudsonensis]TCP11288.1 hypothetical protein EV697_10811 [Bisgaardia hudsonensis]